MDFESFRKFLEWARKNVWTAIFISILAFFIYGSYSFVGGYASKFGESFAGSYNKFKLSIASYTVVDKLLEQYLISYNASRISVGRFHDSTRDLGNNELFFVTFESTIASPGVTLDTSFKDITATTYSAVLPSLLDDKPIFVRTQDLAQTPLKESFTLNGTKAALFIPIHDLAGRLIGMMMVSWLNEADIPKTGITASMTTDLNEVANRVGAYLSAKE